MLSISRGYAVAALLAASMSIPAMARAQTGAAERSLMNRVNLEPRSGVGERQPASTLGIGGNSQASRALLGTVGGIQLAGLEAGAAESGSAAPEQALLGRFARPKPRSEN